MQQLQQHFRDTEVRIVDDDPITVVLSDVAKALGYRDAHRLKGAIKEKYKGTEKVGTPGGPQEMICVTRPGLTQALATLQPQDPEKRNAVESFQDWLYEDVMESIYDTGSYHVSSSGDGAPGAEDPTIAALQAAQQIRQKQLEQEERLSAVEERQSDTTERLDAVEQTLEEARAAPDNPTTRFGHEVQGHTWDGMRKAVNRIVTRRQSRVGGGFQALYRRLYDACQGEFGFHPKRLKGNRGGPSAIKSLDFGEMRALLEVARWVYGGRS